ncbi:nucleoid occlusion protein [Tenuibacillus multivorans]|uniref:Chromosome partitioning protein, ParB family n=1 Tax=Tenuibacillus multivorans TaxID=237069 RepID=A0A1G9W786_9BACI|nr:nucleoid occlusion protein [Tenuibacillus multivorans]GEL76330.1 nucleoid occlusion protein [Tenuibacillus multivorans]SDM80081.1 chromosome partitioning protein, ParB family [Tenuibacillus multivorans]
MSSLSKLFGKNEQNNESKEEYYSDEVVQLPVNQIQPNQYQPRTIFDDTKIDELAQTIHTHGVIQPIVVRKLDEDSGYELIAGERRWRAVQSLEWETIPGIVKDMTDTQTASVALIENLQREELTVIEEAIAYDQLLQIHGLTQEALAQRLGKSQSTIANKMRLLKLPSVVQQAILNKQITERHARALISLKDEDKQEQVLSLIIENHLNVKQTEEQIEQLLNPEPKQKKKKKPKVKGVNKDVRIALNTIRQSLNMVQDTGMDVESEEKDSDDFYQITIKIPKK